MKTQTGMKSQKQLVITCLIPTAFVIIRLTSRTIPRQQMHQNKAINCTKRVILMTLFFTPHTHNNECIDKNKPKGNIQLKTNELETIAEHMIRTLKDNNVAIQRYDSATTSSIYLKLDYGVAFSIRISNHKGKKHLKYRYNVLLDEPSHYDAIAQRYYYNQTNVDMMLNHILAERQRKISKYGVTNYKNFMINNQKTHAKDKRGFWNQSQLIYKGLLS